MAFSARREFLVEGGGGGFTMVLQYHDGNTEKLSRSVGEHKNLSASKKLVTFFPQGRDSPSSHFLFRTKLLIQYLQSW